MARIALDARSISASSGTYTLNLIKQLELLDADNTYLIIVNKPDEHYWQPTNANFSVIVTDIPAYSLAEQTSFKRFLETLHADLVHFCMPQQPLTYGGKKVTTFHDLTLLKTYNSDKNWLIYHAKQFVGSFVFKHIARHNDHLIAVSQYTDDELVKYTGIPADKVSVTYESTDTVDATPRPYAVPFSRYLLYVGRQADYKNIKRFAAAHQALLKKHPDLGLVLAGKKNDATQTNEKYFAEQEYRNIHFTDFVSNDQLSWLYTHATAYVFPSLMEGFGLPGLEAMQHHLPVVSSNATCLPEVYGNAAHYFDPLIIDDISRAINDVLTDDALRQKLIANGDVQLTKYSWKRMAKETHDIYSHILALR